MVNKQKILIVDDDENIAELISLYMTMDDKMIQALGVATLSASYLILFELNEVGVLVI